MPHKIQEKNTEQLIGFIDGWFRWWLVCNDGEFARTAGLECAMVCIDVWFAMMVGLQSWLVCNNGGRGEEGREEVRKQGTTGTLRGTRNHT